MSSFMTPIRHVSTSSNTSVPSPNSSSPTTGGPTSSANTPARVINSAMSTTSVLTNRTVNSNDSMYYICLRLMNSLAKIPGMLPYIELAYNQADAAAEQQAMAISSMESNEFLYRDDATINSSSLGSIANTNTNVSSHSSHSFLSSWNSSLFTFASGLLPAQISYDPVTSISKLLRQGTPLCVMFNALKPENKIDIVSSDDLKICKMNIYQFLSACKLHLNIRDDELFPVTMVFSDNTAHLLRVIHSVEFVLNLEPSFLSPPIPDEIKITDSRSKIVKELIETERRYVKDLDIMVQYRDDLVSSQSILSEDINMLFPQLNEIIDFQRKFLIGLECSASVPHIYQRIGSVFIHAGVEGFKIYENWSLYQSFANDLIKREANKLRNCSKIIKDPYDLQNFFLIKPIQRLLKYPLLLSQLLKESDPSWPNYNELHQAYIISKEVAMDINESKRRSENIQHLNNLMEEVVDWKGYNTNNVGELLFFNVVTVKDLLTDGHSNEKEVHCYLFEKVIYFFKDVSSKNKILGSKKMSNLSFSSNSSGPLQLSLSGIVYVNKIYKITPADNSPYFAATQGHFLTLRWKGNKDTGGCIMKFRSEEQLNQWNNTIKKLSADSNSDDTINSHNSAKSLSSLSSSNSLLTGTTNRTSNTSSFNYNNRNSDRTRSSSDSFMKKLRSTSSSSFSNLNAPYPPLPTEKSIRSMSISSPSKVSPVKKSSSGTSLLTNEEVASNFSNMTLSTVNHLAANTEPHTNIKLLFNKNQSVINLCVPSDIKYNTLVEILVQKISYHLGLDSEVSNSKMSFKFKDEDGDFIRFNGDDDWSIAKEMLAELKQESRILEIMVS
ncbi:unnamed protein product [Pichia kudriavzevii]